MEWLLSLAATAQANEPLSFRYVVQPTIAILLGLRDARLDVLGGRRPYLLSLFEGRTIHRDRLKAGARAVAVPFLVAVAMDAIVQILLDGRFRVGHALVFGSLLIAVPYVAARGIGGRLLAARRRRRIA